MKTDRASSKHGSILGGNFPRKRVKSQWKSTDLEEETIFEDGEMVTFDKAALTVLRDCLRLTNDGKLA